MKTLEEIIGEIGGFLLFLAIIITFVLPWIVGMVQIVTWVIAGSGVKL